MQGYKIKGKTASLSTPLRYILSIVIYITLSAVFLLIGAFITNRINDPLSAVKISACVSLFAAVFLSGIFSAKITEKGSLGSLICGTVFAFTLFIISAINGESFELINQIILLVTVPLVSLFAALICNRKPKKNTLRVKYKKLR